jgi:hypothetical protein
LSERVELTAHGTYPKQRTTATRRSSGLPGRSDTDDRPDTGFAPKSPNLTDFWCT